MEQKIAAILHSDPRHLRSLAPTSGTTLFALGGGLKIRTLMPRFKGFGRLLTSHKGSAPRDVLPLSRVPAR